jgi:hypothetical protein
MTVSKAMAAGALDEGARPRSSRQAIWAGRRFAKRSRFRSIRWTIGASACQVVRRLCGCSDCYRLARPLPIGIRTHWDAVPFFAGYPLAQM